MKVLETFTFGKRNDESLNEDGFFISDDFIVVFDGASSFKEDSGVTIDENKTTGRIARDSILETMESLTPEDSKISKLMLEMKLTEGLRSKLPQDRIDFYRDNQEYGLEVSVVVYSVHNQELWVFGDLNILVNGENYSLPMCKAHKDVINVRCDRVLDSMEHYSVDELQTIDDSFNFIKPLIHIQRNKANTKDGYIVLTGHQINWKLSETIFVKSGDIVILTTDGYVNVEESLQKTEERLQSDLKKDPLCIKELRGMKPHFKENSSFDDRTYVKFKA